MKTLTLINIIALLLSSASCQTITPIDISKLVMDVTVLDEQGNPIEGALVDGRFNDYGKDEGPDSKKLTNAQGKATVSGKFPRSMAIHVTKEGWYTGGRAPSPTLSSKERTIGFAKRSATITLRKKKNPIGLIEIPNLSLAIDSGKEYFYDFIARDWLPPHGKGQVADIVMIKTFESNGKYGSKMVSSLTVDIQFLNKGDGYIGYKQIGWSAFKTPFYHAPTTGYKNILNYTNIRKPGTDFIIKPDYNCYAMRIRTVMDEATGRVKSAYYMKKDGGIFDAGGFLLNPTPNDTNLEQDPQIRLQTIQPQEL